MSASPTSPDHGLGRLVEEGYDVALLGGCLCVGRIPYVTRDRTVGLGTLITPLVFERGQIAPPSGHQVSWSGDIPCDATGRPLHAILHQNYPRRLAGLEAEHMFCAKPLGREYRDYHEMMTTFAVLLGDPAAIIEPLASARAVSRVTSSHAHASVMRYADTASARSGTSGLLGKVAADTVGIVGVGGTGSWILDLVSKTPVAAIHLFDDDVFEQHTAFRSPGATPLATVAAAPAKVDRMAQLYAPMHRRIIPHRIRIDEATAPLLDVLTFAFVCVDSAAARPPIVRRLIERSIPFVDVGMGLHIGDGGIGGIVRTALVPAGGAGAVMGRVPLEGEAADPYSANIQTAELNALNAAFAVLEWKRHRSFYAGGDGASGSLLTLDPPALHPLVVQVGDSVVQRPVPETHPQP